MLQQFQNYIVYQRSLGETTIYHYNRLMKEFNGFLKKDLSSITQEDVSNFLIYLKNKQLKNASIRNYIKVLQIFLRWAAYTTQKDNLVKADFYIKEFVRIKVVPHQPFVPSTVDIENLRNVLKSYLSFCAYDRFSATYKNTLKAYAIIELFITTGIRSAELRSLRLKDIDLENKTIFIKKGKGNYQRTSLFNDKASFVLKEYLDTKNLDTEDFIFSIKQANVINYMIKRWAKRAGINGNIHAHSFRHYFITEAQRQGLRAEEVADQVGHRNLNSTRYYTHFDIEFLKERYSTVNI